MAKITLKGNPIHTSGELPAKGSAAPDFKLVRADLSEASLASFSGKKILNIFPSVDTPVCAISVRTFNKLASEKGVTVLNISKDLPFAQKRFCGAEGIDKAETLSAFRSSFGKDYGVEITDGPLAGLAGRAVLVLDGDNKVIHAELVPEIAQEPNYDAALAALG
ncbi:thiol peroxidase [Polyangium jinanense]|uniref:Thiol peroxidase n=1 Tax=Polyangium jinanense TaxID=2829994 RepID=A0A9X4AP35_9BACT|nr:thiol peroxidase [Polyangium jinanense]MDC3953256.1 thiol peroxidase [Polyangium jinanense]MDC3979624.1 thiol peroxidase [Polyangium jinanense]